MWTTVPPRSAHLSEKSMYGLAMVSASHSSNRPITKYSRPNARVFMSSAKQTRQYLQLGLCPPHFPLDAFEHFEVTVII